MRRTFTTILLSLSLVCAWGQGWPAEWQGVLLQGFYWDSYADSQWTALEAQADELAEFFSLVWLPQSGNCGAGNSMGYNDLYWFENYNSSFGSEEQLRQLIQTFKAKGIGTIADVVINHRSSLADTWMSFPAETYNGATYTLTADDICQDDDSGKTAANAEIAPTGAKDTGEDFDGARDLDHTSANVQTIVKAYLDFLLHDLAYEGFRYDMVKGYAPAYTIMYNQSAQPTFSVGEYFDGDYSKLKAWVDATTADGAIQSAAFDFVLKYKLRDACNAGTGWSALSQQSLMSQTAYRRYAVTFVDNHDTYGRDNDSETTDNILAANAFILAAPGSPCVFLPHWQAYKKDIKQMIYARTLAGIHNQSTYDILYNASSQYAIEVQGKSGKVVVVMGDQTIPTKMSADDYLLISAGDNYGYYLSKSSNTAWADVPSGTYDDAFTVTLTACSAQADAKIVYTTDGSTPTTTNGTVVDSGAAITIDSDLLLTAALLSEGSVSGLITRQYTLSHFSPHDITVYLRADWEPTYYHMWDSDGHETTWPGTHITTTTTIDGVDWYYNTYPLSSAEYYINLVFKKGSNATQTVDVNNINTTRFYEIADTKDGAGHYYVNDVTAQHVATGIEEHVATDNEREAHGVAVYSLDGRLLRKESNADATDAVLRSLPHGIYVVNGKKVVVR